MKSTLPLELDEQPEYDEKWLKKNTVITAKNGLCLLQDGRTAILQDGKVVFRGRWERKLNEKNKEISNGKYT